MKALTSVSRLRRQQGDQRSDPVGRLEPSVLATTDHTRDDTGIPGTGRRWTRIVAYGVLPGLAFVMTMAVGYAKWVDSSLRDAELASMESVQVATDSTIAMLSYHPETAEKDLTAARDRLTGPLKDSYTALIHDVVIPGAKQKQISTVAAVPAAAPVSASAHHAVVLVFVNQTVAMGNQAPTNTASRVRVTLDRVDGRWMVAGFDPI